MHVSGLVMLDPQIENSNGAFDVSVALNCIYTASISTPISEPFPGLTQSLYQMQFTTSLVNQFAPFVGDPLPPGLKAVALVSTQHGRSGAPFPPPFPFAGKTSVTYFKVLADVDGAVDCNAFISGFTIGGTFDAGDPTFDATGSTFIYG